MEPRKIETEFLFEVRIPQGPHHLIGDGPLGHRRITYPRAGARVEGPRLNGTVLDGGGDPFLMRHDGVGEVDARITIQSEGGDVIMMSYKGVLRYSEEFTEAQKRGELALAGRELLLRVGAVRDSLGQLPVVEWHAGCGSGVYTGGPAQPLHWIPGVCGEVVKSGGPPLCFRGELIESHPPALFVE